MKVLSYIDKLKRFYNNIVKVNNNEDFPFTINEMNNLSKMKYK
mgnify:CR=1 FL=1